MVLPANNHYVQPESPRMFVIDVWLVIMGYLSVIDLVRLGTVSL